MSTPFPSDLTDAQWAVIQPMLPEAKSGTFRGGRPRDVNLRVMVNGILYLNRTGCQWRLLPPSFGPWPTVHDYYRHSHWGLGAVGLAPSKPSAAAAAAAADGTDSELQGYLASY